jgi:hypothetical protein
VTHVYNSDVTNWPAGAVGAGKVFLQANATPGSSGFESSVRGIPTGAGHSATQNGDGYVNSATVSVTVCKFRSA